MGDVEPRGCLTAVLRLFGIRLGRQATSDLPYRRRDDFLSAAELSFYRVLRLVVKDRATILTKVNLADIFFVARPNENQTHRNRIDRKHVDFLICDSDMMTPLAGVELDDKSHARADRVARDRLVDSVFEAAGLPLFRIPAQSSYDQNALAGRLAPCMERNKIAPAISPQPVVGKSSPICPKCGIAMVQRMASKGRNQGNTFWGCPNYPRCREIAS
jgi:predicted RNA-binding Zn-ribbon protein involved in translation (DUF1610 family)